MGDRPDTTLWSAPDAVPVSAATGPRVTAAPHRVDGAARFRGAQTVRLASAEPGADLGWMVMHDGVPVRSGVGDTVTVDRTATLRWRATRPGALPSPEEEASFRRIADERRMASLTAPHRAYTGDGADALLDGVRGGEDFRLPTWMGFYGTHVEAVVDLGSERTLRRAAMGFLQDQNSWIFMPRAATFEVSLDGTRWEPVGEAANAVDERADGVVIRDLSVTFAPRPARWLRVRVTAPLMCPDWHKGSGNRSFVFADEIEWE
ncbi:MAG: discoidin domain-containing protein [bacterium]